MANHWHCEYTDTFGGEANYSWVRRVNIPHREGEAQASVMRRAKAALGLTGARGVTTSFGDCFEFRPYGVACVAFVTFRDWEEGEAA